MADYTMWYRVGTVALTKNSKIVTGTDTYWLTASLKPGDMFSVDSVTEYEVQSVDSNTQITLKTAYTGDTTTETDYRIIRTFTSTPGAQIAAETAELLNCFRRYIDSDMQSIHGKSAYQIACDKGYVGTESEWLESLKGDSAYEVAVANGYTGTAAEWLEALKADNEWTTLNDRTSTLTWWDCASLHNSIYRGQDLGDTFTSKQWNDITQNKFTDMWLGDYWTVPDLGKVTIAGFNYIYQCSQRVSGWYTGTVTLLGPSTALNSSDDASNLYAESTWFTTTRLTFLEKVYAFFGGESRFIHYGVMWPISFSGDSPTAWTLIDSKAHLLNSTMMTGFSLYHATKCSNYGNMYSYWKQLPIFEYEGTDFYQVNTHGPILIPDAKPGKVWWYPHTYGAETLFDSTASGCRPVFHIGTGHY